MGSCWILAKNSKNHLESQSGNRNPLVQDHYPLEHWYVPLQCHPAHPMPQAPLLSRDFGLGWLHRLWSFHVFHRVHLGQRLLHVCMQLSGFPGEASGKSDVVPRQIFRRPTDADWPPPSILRGIVRLNRKIENTCKSFETKWNKSLVLKHWWVPAPALIKSLLSASCRAVTLSCLHFTERTYQSDRQKEIIVTDQNPAWPQRPNLNNIPRGPVLSVAFFSVSRHGPSPWTVSAKASSETLGCWHRRVWNLGLPRAPQPPGKHEICRRSSLAGRKQNKGCLGNEPAMRTMVHPVTHWNLVLYTYIYILY